MKSYSRKIKFALIMACAIAVGVISGCATIPAVYVAADRATYNAIAPEYLEYVTQDGTYSPEQKELRRLTIESWERRIKAAEEAGK